MTTDAASRTVPLSGGGAIPILGFGTWQLTGEEAYRGVRSALDVGYRHIDTATAYGNEEQVGRAIRDSRLPRDDIFVTTKLRPEDRHVAEKMLEQSRRLLGLDSLDLWLVHWPNGRDPLVDTWREMVGLRDAGATRAVGVSNYSPRQVDALIEATGDAPAVNQIKWSPWLYDAQRLAHSRAQGVALEGYSPFRASRLRDPALVDIASAHGVTPAQVVLRWHVEHRVIVIPKSARPERIAANADIWGFSLSADEVARLDTIAG
jgi:diketogulonate reductase-like aldo/keto reductase